MLFVAVGLGGVELFCSGSAVALLDSFVGDAFAEGEVLVGDALEIVVVDVARRLPTDWTALAGATVEDFALQEVCGQPTYGIPSEVGAHREDISVAPRTS